MPPQTAAEIAHILFMDIVAYSLLSIEGQKKVIESLTHTVRANAEFQRAEESGNLIILPTGDGLLLAFFGDPCAPIRSAVELARVLADNPDLPLRTGIHSGPVWRTVDANGKINLVGGGLNMAQRVMDCGDARHILLSRDSANIHRNFEEWKDALHDLGECTVKHGMRVHLFNFYREGVGNPERPKKLVEQEKTSAPPGLEETSCFYVPYVTNPHFVGREADMQTLGKLLHPQHGPQKYRRIAIVGMGGEGKTQLAIEYAYRHRSDYPGGVFWTDARNMETLKTSLAEIGRRCFGLSEETDQEDSQGRLAERVQDRLRNLTEPALLILDNVTENTDLTRLTFADCVRTLVTTQREDLPEDFYIHAVHRLDTAAAILLLQSSTRPAEREDEQRAAWEIVEIVGCLPLAVALAARHIKTLHCSFARYRKLLAADLSETLQDAREYFKSATGHSGSIFDTINLSCKGLSEQAVMVLKTAACFSPRDIPVSLLSIASNLTEPEFRKALNQLRVRSLISDRDDSQLDTPLEEDEPGSRIAMHELIREYARISPPEDCLQTALQNTLQTLARTLFRANEEMDWTQIRRDIVHCHTLDHYCCRADRPLDGLDELICELGRYTYEQRELKEARDYLEESRERIARLYGEKSVSYARILPLLAVTCQDGDDSRNACTYALRALRAALALRPVNQRVLADCFNDVGYVLRWQTERGSSPDNPRFIHLNRALYLYNRAYETYPLAFNISVKAEEKIKDAKLAMCLNNIGVVFEEKGELDKAFSHFQRARVFARRAYPPENVTLAIYLNNMGRIRCKQGRYAEARDFHREARDIYRVAYHSNHPDVAESLALLAEAHNGLQETEEVCRLYRQMLDIYEALPDPTPSLIRKREKARARLAALQPAPAAV